MANLTAQTLAKDAVLFGFESPPKSGRSVVALTADRTSGQADVLNAPDGCRCGGQNSGVGVGCQGMGRKPTRWTTATMCRQSASVDGDPVGLANQSWIASLLIVLVATMLAGVLYTVLRRQAQRRITGNELVTGLEAKWIRIRHTLCRHPQDAESLLS